MPAGWGGFAPCSSPKSYSGLSEGAHTFQVRTKDAAGNVDPSPDSRSFTVAVVNLACDIQMSQQTYGNGDLLTAAALRVTMRARPRWRSS